jgi:hypothetical protein
MKQQVSKQTKISQIVQLYAYNQAYIQKVANLTEFEYNNFLFQCGIKFLEELYPPIDTFYKKYYQEHAYSKSFWKWWKVEFKQWENNLIEHLKLNKFEIDKGIYFQEMEQMYMDGYVEIDFQNNYQKHLKYVI